MDWTMAIERNREALKRVLAGLLVMARLTGGNRAVPGAGYPLPTASTLPRTLYRAILRLLRPAEAAARRLVIVAARGLSGTLPQVRPHRPAAKRPPLRRVAHGFRLFDPPQRFCRPRRRSPSVLPRISFPGFTGLAPIRQPPMPFDPIDTAPLARRLATLAAALDDLPRQARRFARWQARLAAERHPAIAVAQRQDDATMRGAKTRSKPLIRRVWPLRPGRPPGRHSPRDRHPAHEVHEVLDTVHGLALWALEPPDTS